jgi:hypothetical protein
MAERGEKVTDGSQKPAKTKNLHAIGGVALKRLIYMPNEAQKGLDLSGVVKFLGGQAGSGKFCLRYISHGNGEIGVYLLFRVEGRSARRIKAEIGRVLQALTNYLHTHLRDYEFDPIADIDQVLKPFKIRTMAEISRQTARVTIASWDTNGQQALGFRPDQAGEVHGTQEEGKVAIDYVVPWIRPLSSLRGLCETLSRQQTPCLIDFGITPLVADEAVPALRQDEKQILICENYLQGERVKHEGTVFRLRTQMMRDWICEQKSLMEVPGNIYSLRVRVAGKGPLNPELLQAVGEAVTAPPQASTNRPPFIAGGFSIDEVNAGNYADYIYQLQPEKASENCSQYLFDGGSAGAALVLPQADGLEFPSIDVRPVRFLEAPKILPWSGTLIGEVNACGTRRPLCFQVDDQRHHVLVVGKTGTAKTTALVTMALANIRNGHGVAFFDPHGDAADYLLDHIPEERAGDVIYFNVGDTSHPIGLNLLQCDTAGERVHIRAEFLSYMAMQFLRIEQGPIFWSFLTNGLDLLMSNSQDPGTLVHFPMLVDEEYRRRWLAHVKDPRLRFYWERTFPDLLVSRDGGMIGYLTSKFEVFTADPCMRNIIGQKRCSINFEDVINNRKILVARMSKGDISEKNSALLCMIFIARLWTAAIKRIKVPIEERKDFYIYVDEFQNLATETFTTALSEARKFRLNFVLSNQYTAQLPEHVQQAVLGNVGSVMAFRTGPEDAQRLKGYFDPSVSALALASQPNYHAYMRMMVDGVMTPPFSMWTKLDAFSLPENWQRVRERIVANSRELYGRPVAEVEREIAMYTAGCEPELHIVSGNGRRKIL